MLRRGCRGGRRIRILEKAQKPCPPVVHRAPPTYQSATIGAWLLVPGWIIGRALPRHKAVQPEVGRYRPPTEVGICDLTAVFVLCAHGFLKNPGNCVRVTPSPPQVTDGGAESMPSSDLLRTCIGLLAQPSYSGQPVDPTCFFHPQVFLRRRVS